jgi:nuclear pore complex protein Nup107
VSLSALSLAPQDGGPSPETTAEALALWRRTCLAIARQTDVDDYERAVYGVLSGDIATVERVSSTWDDFVFAHYNAVIRSQFDSFILSKCAPEEAASLSQSFIAFDAAQKAGEPAALEKRFLKALEQSNGTMEEARNPYKVFQAAVLVNELEQYFFDQGLVLGQEANKEAGSKMILTLGRSSSNMDNRRFYTLANHHGIRVISHAYIIMSQLEKLSPGSTIAVVSSDASRALLQQNLTSAYISLLRLSDAPELIPLYCSTLDETRQYETLCRNLIHVTDDVVRVRCIKLITKSGLNALKFVQDLACLQLRTVLAREESRPAAKQFRILEVGPTTIKYGRPVKADFFADDPDRIDKSHELLIRSVEWLTLVDVAWPDVLSIATKAYKHFLSRLPFTFQTFWRNPGANMKQNICT